MTGSSHRERPPIRVAHVLHSFGTGGLEKGIATLVSHGHSDFEHIILCLAESGETARLLPSGTRVVELHKQSGNSLRFLWQLGRALKRLAPDVVHTRNWSGLDGVIAARISGSRAVIHGEHGWGMEDSEGLSRKRIHVRRFLSRWVREYTCVSKAMEHWLRDTVGVRKPVTQIYNGVDTATYAPCADRRSLRSEFGFPPSGFLVGVVGRLDPIKDHRTLFRAFASVRQESPDSLLVVVGDGPERKSLEAIAGPDAGVLFLGNREDVPEILRCLDVFVLPSLNEGISNVLLEAMATAVPVVASRVGGNGELVDDGTTGILVPPGAADSLAEAVLTYLRAPNLRRAHGSTARERVVRGFQIRTMVEGYESVYRSAVGRASFRR